MIPLKTQSAVFSPPIVTWVIIALNVAVFLWMRGQGDVGFQRAMFEYSAIPQNISGEPITILMYDDGEPLAAIQAGADPIGYREDFEPTLLRVAETPDGPAYSYMRVPLEVVSQKISPWLTILAAMFMHAGWLHLIFNMWALHVFGPNVEDTMGRLGFLLFYIVCGLAATAAQLVHEPGSVIPTLGASGAISGVMGGIAVRFPTAAVITLVPILFLTIAHLPVWVFMLIYIGEQVFMSLQHSQDNGGVAWWAHIGGFAAGYFLIRFFPVARAWKEVFGRR